MHMRTRGSRQEKRRTVITPPMSFGGETWLRHTSMLRGSYAGGNPADLHGERGMLGVQEAAEEAALHILVYFINSTASNPPPPSTTHMALWTLTLSMVWTRTAVRLTSSEGVWPPAEATGDICSPRLRTVCVTNNPGTAVWRSGVSFSAEETNACQLPFFLLNFFYHCHLTSAFAKTAALGKLSRWSKWPLLLLWIFLFPLYYRVKSMHVISAMDFFFISCIKCQSVNAGPAGRLFPD